MRERGFSLLELVVSMTLLSVLSVLTFSLFAQGSSLFRLGSSRGNLQTEMRRLIASMGREITHSSFYSCASLTSAPLSVEPGGPGQTRWVQRDTLSCAALRDPLASASYDPQSGLARWDCYTIYLATDEVPQGKLLRFRVDSPFDTAGPTTESTPLRGQRNGLPYDTLAPLVTAYPASTSDTPVLPDTTRLLTSQLLEFQAGAETSTQLVRVRVVLRGEEGRITQGHHTTAELLEGKLTFKPENTWPRL